MLCKFACLCHNIIIFIMYRIPKIVRGVRRVLIKLCPNYHHFTLFPSYISYIVSLYSLLITITYWRAEVCLVAGAGPTPTIYLPPLLSRSGSWQLQAARGTKHTTNWDTGNTTVKTTHKYVGLEPWIQHRLCPSGEENVITSYTMLMWFIVSLVPG